MDVGVDTKDFYPYEWSEIRNTLRDVPIFAEEELVKIVKGA